MKDKVIEIKLWQTKCQFCGQKFASEEREKVRQALCDHINNNCKVLSCLCIVKDIEYPLRDKMAEAK